METKPTQPSDGALRRIRLRAALWVTELHGPDRDARLEEQVRRWIAQDARHAAAFESATRAWECSGGLAAPFMETPGVRRRRRGLRLAGTAVVSAAVVCAGILGVRQVFRGDTLATGPGEQRLITLSDGTQVSLNANSRLVVDFDDQVRRVTLMRGEGAFNVVKHQARPFVVVIGDRKVVAVGTSFMVRREQDAGAAFDVTLLEGRVAVEPIAWPDKLPTDFVSGLHLLNPGERLRFEGDGADKVDSPSISRITAWQRRKLVFDDQSLSEAVAEFNRYGLKQIILEGEGAGRLRVGGVFRIDDAASFARSMANVYNLDLTFKNNDIILRQKQTPESTEK